MVPRRPAAFRQGALLASLVAAPGARARGGLARRRVCQRSPRRAFAPFAACRLNPKAQGGSKIAAIDLDGTLVGVKSGAQFARGPGGWQRQRLLSGAFGATAVRFAGHSLLPSIAGGRSAREGHPGCVGHQARHVCGRRMLWMQSGSVIFHVLCVLCCRRLEVLQQARAREGGRAARTGLPAVDHHVSAVGWLPLVHGTSEAARKGVELQQRRQRMRCCRGWQNCVGDPSMADWSVPFAQPTWAVVSCWGTCDGRQHACLVSTTYVTHWQLSLGVLPLRHLAKHQLPPFRLAAVLFPPTDPSRATQPLLACSNQGGIKTALDGQGSKNVGRDYRAAPGASPGLCMCRQGRRPCRARHSLGSVWAYLTQPVPCSPSSLH